MSIIKSFTVRDGDMFYINHDSYYFTIIDCCLPLDDELRKDLIIEEIEEAINKRTLPYNLIPNNFLTRFLSTSPDMNHIKGLKQISDKGVLYNLYCIKNKIIEKIENKTDDIQHYLNLIDSGKYSEIKKGISRYWDGGNDLSNIDILWPDTDNDCYKEALKESEKNKIPKNISPIIRYSPNNSHSFLWMGNLETEFIEDIAGKVSWQKTDILFTPHNGINAGVVPQNILNILDPKIIVVLGVYEIEYRIYSDVIKQNEAGDITFYCVGGMTHIFVSNKNYQTLPSLIKCENIEHIYPDEHYIGTLE